MPIQLLDVSLLVDLLERGRGPASSRALEMARALPPGHRVGVAIQHAASTAATLATKYRMAEASGAKVDGLMEMTEALAGMGAAGVGCATSKAMLILLSSLSPRTSMR